MKKFNRKHKIIHSLIKKEDPIILEIGAHLGIDSKLFLDHYPKANIYCFEPDSRNLPMLYKLNEIVGNKLNIIEAAVYNEENEKKVFYQTNKKELSARGIEKLIKHEWITEKDLKEKKLANSSSSSLKSGHPYTKEAGVTEVKTITLDKWAQENSISSADLLWIDVQGAEKEVLEGAENILNNTDYIFIEYGETEYEGGLTREETVQMLSDKFNVLEGYSSSSKKGDLILSNKKLRLSPIFIFKGKIFGILKKQYLRLKNIKKN